jgi:hypothetical protein
MLTLLAGGLVLVLVNVSSWFGMSMGVFSVGKPCPVLWVLGFTMVMFTPLLWGRGGSNPLGEEAVVLTIGLKNPYTHISNRK